MGCKVEQVLAPNGQPSKVYASVSSVYGTEVGLMTYLHMHSDAFVAANKETPKDENGEHNWKQVVKSMEDSGTSIKSIVEKSVGVVGATGRYAKFKTETGATKVEELNRLFKRENTPFTATLHVDEAGDVHVHVDVLTQENLMPRKSNREVDSDDDYYGSDVIDEWTSSDEDGARAQRAKEDNDAMDIYNDEVSRKSEIVTKHKFRAMLESIQLQKQSTERRIARIEENVKLALTAKDLDKVKELKIKLANFNVTLSSLIEKEDEVRKLTSTRKASTIADRDLFAIGKKAKDMESLEVEELMEMQRLLNFWITAGSFESGTTHMFLSDNEVKSEVLRGIYRGVASRASDIEIRVNKELENRFEKFLQEYISPDTKMSDAMKLAKDVSFMEANMLDISRTDNVIFQAIYKAVTQQEQRGQQDADAIAARIDAMMPKVMERLSQMGKSGEDPFDFFAQEDSQGRRSGDMVTAISYDFEQAKQTELYDVLYNNKATKAQKKKAKEWSKKNEVVVDYRKLFFDNEHAVLHKKDDPFTAEDRAAHITELEEVLGKDETAKILKKMESELDEYQLGYEAKKAELFHNVTEKSLPVKTRQLNKWIGQQSPFWASRSYITGKKTMINGSTMYTKAAKTLTFIPKKVVDGKPTKWYDSKYAAIQKDPVLKEFYDEYLRTMKELNMFIPISKRHKFKENSISFVQKTLKEMAYMEDGKVNKGMLAFYKRASTEALRSKDYSTVTGNSADPATGEKIRHVQANFINDGKGELRDLMRNKQLVWQASNKGAKPSKADLTQWRYESLNEVAMMKSYNLGQALKSYAMLANAYKYKSVVEDDVHLAYNMFNRIKEKLTNNKDEQLTDKYGDERFQKGLSQMKAQLDHFMDKFNNFTTRGDTVATKKLYTDIEQARKKELEDALKALEEAWNKKPKRDISKKHYARVKADLEEQLEKIGGELSVTKVGDAFLNLSQLKGMAWNIPAGLVNRMYGFLTNVVESASGRFASPENFSRANKMVTTFGNKKEREKAFALAKKFGIVVDTQKEVDQGLESSLLGGLGRYFQPYYIGEAVELRNQTPILIAKMLDTIVNTKEDGTGEDITLFDAFDENGNLKADYPHLKKDWDGMNADRLQNKKRQELIGAATQVIKKIHGNYHQGSPVLAKKDWIGRALLQFKSWLGESIAARFETEKEDHVAGFTRKGRYRSVWDAKDADGNHITELGALVANFKHVVIGVFTNTFDKNGSLSLSEVDIQNLREVAKELQMVLALLATGLALSTLRGELDDEDDRIVKYATTFALNNIVKTQKDLAAFLSPTWVFDMIDRPVAAVSVTNDLSDNIASAIKILGGDYTIDSGINAGWNRPLKEAIELMPLANQVFKLRTMSLKVYEDPKSIRSAIGKTMSEWIHGEEDK